MPKCPICEKSLDGITCQHCGYDAGLDYEKYPTVMRIPFGAKGQKAIYQAKVDAAVKQQKPKIQPVPVEAHNADFVAEGDRLVKYLGSSPYPRVPDGIRIIGKNAFAENETIRTVTLPDTVVEIGERAFYSCTNLHSVVFPSGLEIIGDSAFAYSGFNTGTLPDSLKQLGDSVFSSTNMERVRVPSKVKVVPKYAFRNCHFLREVELCEGVEKIDMCALNYCEALRTIIIPYSLKRMEIPFVGTENISNVAASITWKAKNPQILKMLMPSSVKVQSVTNQKDTLKAGLRSNQNKEATPKGRKVNITLEKAHNLIGKLQHQSNGLLCRGRKRFDKQVLKAKNNYAPYANNEIPLLMLDDSIGGELMPSWGPAKTGFVLTDQNLYYNLNDRKGKTALEDITSVTIQKSRKDSSSGYVVLNTNEGDSGKACRILCGTDRSLLELQAFWKALLQLN